MPSMNEVRRIVQALPRRAHSARTHTNLIPYTAHSNTEGLKTCKSAKKSPKRFFKIAVPSHSTRIYRAKLKAILRSGKVINIYLHAFQLIWSNEPLDSGFHPNKMFTFSRWLCSWLIFTSDVINADSVVPDTLIDMLLNRITS